MPKGRVSAMTDGSPSLLELQAWLSGNATPVACLVDSGATHTFIASEVVAGLGLQPVPAEQLEVTLADGSVFVCSEKVNVPVVFGAMGTFGEHYPCTLTCLVAGRLHQDVILGMDWLQCEDPLISWRDFTVTFPR